MQMPDRRQLRRAIPRPIRQRLYDWSPSRRRRWRETPGLTRIPPGAGVALTFDDGPDPVYTPRLLDVLAELRATATFFVIGERVAREPGVVREIAERGHEVGLHGMTHRRHDRLDEDEARRDLTLGLEATEAALGRRPRRYRPPYGGSSPALASICAELGLEIAYWSAWGQDWEEIPAAEIARLALRGFGAGSVILLHDSALYADRENAGPTLEAVPIVAGAARDLGLNLVSLAAALDGSGG
jgi:peptidoglycan/xylan/chitin deacetylase (PgdA/CDA1 family)